MPSFSNVCGSSADANKIITTGGINNSAVTGALEGVVFTFDDFRFDNPGAAELVSNWNAGVAAGTLFYIGKGKFANEGEEASFFEDSDYGVRILQSKGTKVVEFRQVVCACTHSKLLQLNGQTGRVFFQTKLGIIIGRMEQDRKIGGFQAQIQFEFRTLPTSDTPVAETIMTITFSEPESDERNPFEITSDFQFSDIDQIYSIEGTTNTVASNGSALTFNLVLTKDCTTNPYTGLLLADFEAEDVNGNALTIASVTETGTTGVYAVNITTALTQAIIRTDGIQTESGSGLLFYLNDVVATVVA